MTSDIRNVVSEYLHRELMQDRPNYELTDDTDLLTAHIIDSLGIFMLVTFLEEKFGIVVDADEVLVEHFETIARITDFVERKLEAGAAVRSV